MKKKPDKQNKARAKNRVSVCSSALGRRTTLTMRGWARTRYGWKKGAQWARRREEADWCDRMNGVSLYAPTAAISDSPTATSTEGEK